MNTKSDIRISIRKGSGETRKIELFLMPYLGGKHYMVKIDGNQSKKLPIATITDVTHKIREWLCQKG